MLNWQNDPSPFFFLLSSTKTLDLECFWIKTIKNPQTHIFNHRARGTEIQNHKKQLYNSSWRENRRHRDGLYRLYSDVCKTLNCWRYIQRCSCTLGLHNFFIGDGKSARLAVREPCTSSGGFCKRMLTSTPWNWRKRRKLMRVRFVVNQPPCWLPSPTWERGNQTGVHRQSRRYSWQESAGSSSSRSAEDRVPSWLWCWTATFRLDDRFLSSRKA